jgi:hypothetical protein
MKKYFVIPVAIIIIVTLVACEPKADPNQDFVNNLKELIGTPTEEMPAIAYQHTYTAEYASWMQNNDLGTFVNTRGEEVKVKTVQGEPQYSLEKRREEAQWVEPIGEIWQTVCTGPKGNHNYVVIYGSGNAGTIGRFKENETIIQNSACNYFAKSSAPINVLHLNFHSTGGLVSLVDIGSFGTVMPLEPFDWELTSSLASNLRDEFGTVVRTDVILQLNNLNRSAEQVGFTSSQVVTMALANEMVGWLSGQQINAQLNKPNEAYSTIYGLLVAFDPVTAHPYLGEYESFVQLFVDEMAILTNIANR